MSLELRSPNDEQKLAIEHSGGVLLSAGAGSGKTFVLVEHIIYLFNKFYQDNPADIDEFDKKLKDYFSKIVLMTFTNKAAGELEMRIQSRFQLGLERSMAELDTTIPVRFWEVGIQSLSSLYVGTIHGFCYRLITQGHIPGLTGTEELINDVDFTRKISQLVDQFFEDSHWKENTHFYDRLVLNKKNIKKAMANILSDTDLRVLWNSIKDIEELSQNQDEYIQKILKEVTPLSLSELEYDFESIRPKPTKKGFPGWFSFAEDWHKRKEGLSDPVDLLQALAESLGTITKLTKPKTEDPEIIGFYDGVKEVRDKVIQPFLKDLVAYKESPEILKMWGEDVLKIYRFIENKYLHIKGLTFTDLEFYVWKQLAHKENSQRVGESFSYFIIDEFQDTSKVQFDIVNFIIESDMNKVFSVGDVKQAIYGFRGGELGVFQNASEKTYKNLSLKNNYRSSKEVIEFNNSLFEYLLPLGREYSGEDKHSVEMIKQAVPESVSKVGKIKCYSRTVTWEGEDKPPTWYQTDMNKAESHVIAEILSQKEPEEEFCVLYRKLAPTKFLIPMLSEKGVGFSCQVKVEIKEDPFLCLFIEFARACSFVEDEKSYKSSLKLLERLVHILKQESCHELSKSLKDLATRQESLGLLETFKRFVWSIGLSTSNVQNSWPIIKTLSDISGDRAEYVFDYANPLLQGSYSLEFQHGEENQKIKIMTSHASKGLEFSKVILGGIHTNGGSKSDSVFFGKIPGSYKWIQGVGKSKVFESPAMMYEKLIKKEKEFSEFKRLFYVATTRAVSELLWVDLAFNEKSLCYGQEGWIRGIRKFIDHTGYKIEVDEKEIPYESIFTEGESLSLRPPMFFKDNLGMEFLETSHTPLAIGAELSVTRFASLLHCPRKFFLKNVLKITEDEIELSKDDSIVSVEEDKLERIDDGDAGEIFQTNGVSLRERGIFVHSEIEHAIKHNFIPKLNSELDSKTQEGIQWILEELKPLSAKGFKFISEEPVKFSLFGQMVSGTPDLVLTNKNEIQIWDFKTGKYGEKKSEPYWLQLYSYIWAYAQKMGYPENLSITVSLAFVDEKKLVDKNPSLSDVETSLFNTWSLLDDPDRINTDHCFMCEYQSICSKQ
ncbi:MAG: UvrD-helicase domain-containing protein [Halobacteriovoraceae bacterium]|nr:UvrD-helicase domain-containing protein [Halobacteriovoraceae bacterium]